MIVQLPLLKLKGANTIPLQASLAAAFVSTWVALICHGAMQAFVASLAQKCANCTKVGGNEASFRQLKAKAPFHAINPSAFQRRFRLDLATVTSPHPKPAQSLEADQLKTSFRQKTATPGIKREERKNQKIALKFPSAS